MATQREELQAYRERVFEELRTRMERLKGVDGEIASMRYLIEQTRSSRALRAGDTVRVLVRASQKARLLREHARLEGVRAQILEDVRRAEERLEEVDSDLDALEDASEELKDEVGED